MANKKIILLLMALGLTGALGCGKTTAPDALIAYAENPANGLRKTIAAGKMQYTLQYRPAGYVLAKEGLSPGTEAYTERKEQLQGMAWFVLRFQVEGFSQSPLRYRTSGQEDYTQRQDYYLNMASGDMRLIYGKDTLGPSGYWFENNQNLTDHESILVGFALPGNETVPDKDMTFTFYDQLFRNGIIKATIARRDLEKANKY